MAAAFPSSQEGFSRSLLKGIARASDDTEQLLILLGYI